MKIMFVSTGLGLGGAERQVADLADRLVAKGHEVSLVCMTGEIAVRPLTAGIPIVHLGMTKSPLASARSFARLIRHIRQQRPDVVHGHMVHANLLTRLARVFTSIPVLVSTAHSRNEGGQHRMWAYRITDGLCDVFTNVGVVAVEAFERARAAPPGRIRSMANGIDTDRFHPDEAAYHRLRAQEHLPPDRLLFLAVGRFVEAKDYPNLLQAFSRVAKQHPRCELWIAGGGPLLPEAERLTAELELDGRVRFLGIRQDIPDLMRMADVYVLSSRWEGMPLVVGEAMASGLPVVATDCGGVLEYVGDKSLLAVPGNPEALAGKMSQAASMTAAELQQAGQVARRRIVDRFSLEAITNQWLEIYQAVLSPSEKGAKE